MRWRIERRRRGQYSAYLKPLLVIVFVILLLFVLQSLLGFQMGMQEERVQVDFQQEVRRDMQHLVDCLRVNPKYSGSSYVLNYSKLAAYHRQYRFREPPCAEDITYGFNVTVKETFLTSRDVKTKPDGPADVVFALDDSGSMGGYLQAVKDNVQSFMQDMPPGSRVGMFTYATPCQKSEKYADWTPKKAHPDKPHDSTGIGDDDFPSEFDSLDCWVDNVVPLSENVGPVENELTGIGTAGGSEPEDGAIRLAREHFDWKDGRRKIIIVLATEEAEEDSATNLTVYGEAQVAAEQDFETYTVAEKFYKDQYGRIADATGAEFFPISNDFSSILGEISRSSNRGIGESTCVAPKQEQVEGATGKVDTAFVLDVTGSMQEHINGVKQNIRDFMGTVGQDTRVAVVAYRDGVTKTQTFTGDSWKVEEFLQGLTASGGGDGPEGVHKGIDKALSDLDWRQDAVKSAVVVNQAGAHNHGEDCSPYLSRLADEAKRRGITLYTVVDMFGQGDTPDLPGNVPDPSDSYSEKYCGPELTETLPQTTGGKYYDLNGNWQQVLDRIAQKEGAKTVVAGDVMCQPTYQFGEREGSDGNGLQRDMVLQFPVTVWHREDLQTPAVLKINLRDGGLERLTSAINAVVRSGKQTGQEATGTLRIQNKQQLYSNTQPIERPLKTRYRLVNSNTGSNQVAVENDLNVGINGNSVFEDSDGAPTTIDFSNRANQFTAYKGAAIQFIVKNLDGGVTVDPIAVQCASGTCAGDQPVDIAGSGTGQFAHGFTELTIGNMNETTEPVVCARTGGEEDSCTVVRAGSVSDFALNSGNHLLRITYDPATNEVTVRG